MNCHLFQGTVAAFFKRDLLYRDEERAQAIVAWCIAQDAHVVILSEVWSSSMKDALINALLIPYRYFWRATSPCCLLTGPEFIVASVFPIAHIASEPLADLASWDRASAKMICALRICATDIYLSHFDATSSQCHARNLAQTIALYTSHAVQVQGAPARAIICGDLNIQELFINASGLPEQGGEYINMSDQLTALHFVDTYRHLHANIALPENFGATVDGAFNTVATHFDPSGHSRLDYFWLRGRIEGLISSDVARVDLSDHYPIVLTLDSLN